MTSEQRQLPIFSAPENEVLFTFMKLFPLNELVISHFTYDQTFFNKGCNAYGDGCSTSGVTKFTTKTYDTLQYHHGGGCCPPLPQLMRECAGDREQEEQSRGQTDRGCTGCLCPGASGGAAGQPR